MSKVKHISFEELAGNLAAILDKVRDEHTPVVEEYASGEKLMIRPFSPSTLGVQKEESTQQPLNQLTNPESASSMGAIYDLDPDSITPG